MEEKKPKRRISPLSVKILSASIAFAALLCSIITYMGYRHFSKTFVDQYKEMTTQFAYIASSYVSGDDMKTYIKNHTIDLKWSEINGKLTEITNIADLDSISVTSPDAVRYDTQTYIFHAINAHIIDNEKKFPVYGSESLLVWERPSIVNVKRLIQLGRSYSEIKLRSDEKGHTTGTVSSAIPIRDEYNNIVAMLTVKKSIDELLILQALYFKKISVVALFVTLVFILIYGAVLWRMVIRPILMIKNETIYFSEHNELSGMLSKIRNHDEIGSLSNSVEEMSGKINRYITELTKVTAEKERISTELNVATKIQSDMLPKAYPPFPARKDFDLFAKMDPAKEVGGDLFDYLLLDSDHLMLVVGDVSGKGVPAALFMVIAKTLLSSHAAQGLSPSEIFEITNNQLCNGNETGLFVTCWLGILTFSTGELRFVNAGHPYPVLYHDGNFSFVKTKPNFVLGGMEGLHYKEHSITLEKGDRIFVYTDGVTEATDSSEELFGEERLLEAMKGTENLDSPETLKSVRASIDKFVGEAEQFDDITMLDFIWK